jgi:hypothetical protein
MRALVALALVSCGILLSVIAVAEDERGLHSAPKQTRSTKIPIPFPIRDWIAKHFHFSKEYIEEQWGDRGDGTLSLPGALNSLKEGKYEQVAQIAAQLMGTANPEIAKRAFASARAELISRHAKADESNQDTKNEYDFFESMLFGFWQWPQDKDKKQAFCGETIRSAQAAVKGRNEADVVPSQWENNAPLGLASVYQGLQADDGKPTVKDGLLGADEEESLKQHAAKSCFNDKYAPFQKFKGAFETAANDVWKWNQEYHKNKEVIAKAATTEEDKAAQKAAFQAISENVDGKNLTSFAFQQELSGWKDPTDSTINLGRKEADRAFGILAGILNNNELPEVRKVELTKNKEAFLTLEWKAGESAMEKILSDPAMKTDLVQNKTAPLVSPVGFDKPRPPIAPAVASQPTQTPPAAQPTGTASQTADTANQPNTVVPQANTFGVNVADPATASVVAKAQAACIACHVAKNANRKSDDALPVTMSLAVLTAGVQSGMLDDGYLLGKIAPAEMATFKQWANVK